MAVLRGDAGFGWSPGTLFAIASSTNASPIVVTTSASHGFSNGENIRVANHTTNTAANGTWVAASVSSTTVALTGSTGNGVGGATGTAAFEQRHNMRVPLRNIRPTRYKRRFSAESLDFSATERVIVGSEYEGIVALIRYDDAEPSLQDMLRDGADGDSLIYYPSLATVTTSYTFVLVSPVGDVSVLAMDSDRGNMGEHEVELELRREDGGVVDGLL